MSWDWLRLEAKFDGVEPPDRVTLVTFAGTWSQPDWGFQADVARALNDEWFRWLPVHYPATFGPVAPPYPGAPAYVDSVTQGVRNGIGAVHGVPGSFILSGYSQGAEVAGRLCVELVEGQLQHRLKDCLGCVTFGDPARQSSDETHGGGEGAGISRLVIPPGIRRITYAAPGDMYCTTPDSPSGDQMHAVYTALTRMGDGKVNGLGGLVVEVAKLLKNPLLGGIVAIESIIRALQVAQHGAYAQWVPHAAQRIHQLAGV